MDKIWYLSVLAVISIFTFLTGCRPTILTPKGEIINKTNLNFLKEAGVDERTNPHIDGTCTVCHQATNEILTKENPSRNEAIQKRLMKTDLIGLCVGCHTEALKNQHKVGIGTKLNRENLPLDHEGKITCATTCHDMHAKEPERSKKMLRHLQDVACLSCHDV